MVQPSVNDDLSVTWFYFLSKTLGNNLFLSKGQSVILCAQLRMIMRFVLAMMMTFSVTWFLVFRMGSIFYNDDITGWGQIWFGSRVGQPSIHDDDVMGSMLRS